MAKQYIKNEQKNQTRSTNCNRKTANDKKIINLLKAKQLYDCQHHYNSANITTTLTYQNLSIRFHKLREGIIPRN